MVVDCPSSGHQQVFLCQKWLADDEGDQLIERDLFESEDMRLKRRPSKIHVSFLKFKAYLYRDLICNAMIKSVCWFTSNHTCKSHNLRSSRFLSKNEKGMKTFNFVFVLFFFFFSHKSRACFFECLDMSKEF